MILKPCQNKKGRNVCWDASKLPVFFLQQTADSNFKRYRYFMSIQQRFGLSYFARALRGTYMSLLKRALNIGIQCNVPHFLI